MSNLAEVKKQAAKTKVVTVYDFLEQKKDLIASALPKSITPERLIGVFTMVLRASPELANCSQMSLISAVIQTVQLGLTPGNIGHCYYIPFNNKKGREVQFVIGYKGIVELVNRCGKASILSTEVVYENDQFTYELGLNPILSHVPTSSDRGAIRGVYSIAKNLVANEKVFIYLTKEDIDKVRASSKAGQSDYSPWAKWYSEMAKKTAIKRICKLLPLSVDDQRNIATDETIKNEIQPDMTSVKDDTNWDQEETVDVTPGIVKEVEKITPEDIDKVDMNKIPEYVPRETPNIDPETGKTEDEVAAENGHIVEVDRSNCISEPQIKRLFAISKSKNWSKDKVDEYILNTYNLKSRKDIPKGMTYTSICDHIENNPEWSE